MHTRMYRHRRMHAYTHTQTQTPKGTEHISPGPKTEIQTNTNSMHSGTTKSTFMHTRMHTHTLRHSQEWAHTLCTYLLTKKHAQTFTYPHIPTNIRPCMHMHTHTHTHTRSEEHTSELQSLLNLVCRLLLEKKKQTHTTLHFAPHARDT